MLAVLGVIAQEFGTFDFYNAKSKLQLSPDRTLGLERKPIDEVRKHQ